MDRIYLTDKIFLLELKKNRFTPYRQIAENKINPIRGYDKHGKMVWRTYDSVEDAKINLKI